MNTELIPLEHAALIEASREPLPDDVMAWLESERSTKSLELFGVVAGLTVIVAMMVTYLIWGGLGLFVLMFTSVIIAPLSLPAVIPTLLLFFAANEILDKTLYSDET